MEVAQALESLPPGLSSSLGARRCTCTRTALGASLRLSWGRLGAGGRSVSGER